MTTPKKYGNDRDYRGAKLVDEALKDTPHELLDEVIRQLAAMLFRQLESVDIEIGDRETIDDLKLIIATTDALRQYAKRASLELETVNQAAEVNLEAQRKEGQWITRHIKE